MDSRHHSKLKGDVKWRTWLGLMLPYLLGGTPTPTCVCSLKQTQVGVPPSKYPSKWAINSVNRFRQVHSQYNSMGRLPNSVRLRGTVLLFFTNKSSIFFFFFSLLFFQNKSAHKFTISLNYGLKRQRKFSESQKIYIRSRHVIHVKKKNIQ